MTRVANFCPKCGARLEQRERYGRLRPVCPACDHIMFFDPKVAVVALILRDESREILLVLRGVDPGKGRWALPAGFVDAGEDPKAAVRREALEETGLEIAVERLLDVLYVDDEGMADIVIAYAAREVGGTLAAQDDAEQVAWFGRDNLPELVFATTDILIGRWQRGAL